MTEGRSADRRVAVLLACTLLLGFAMRLVDLHRVDLGMDGGLSLAMAVVGPMTVLQLSASDVHPPLYYLLLNVWVAVGGTTPFAAKYFSVIFGVLAIAASFALGRRLGSRRTGLFGAALLAVSPVWVISAAAVRDFVAAGFFAIVSSFALIQSLDAEDGRKRHLLAHHILFVVATLLATLTSYLCFSVFAAQMLFVALRSNSRKRWSTWLGLTVASALVYSAWLWFAISSRVEAKVDILASRPSSDSDSLAKLLWDALRQLTVGDFLSSTPWPWAAVYAVVLLAGLLLGLRRVRRQGAWRMFFATRLEVFLLVALALALAIDYAIVRFWLHDSLPSRYLVIASPFFILLVARSLDLLMGIRRLLAVLACSLLLVGGVLGLKDFYARPYLPVSVWNPQGMVEYLDSRAATGDGVVFTNLEQAGYYSALSKRHLSWYAIMTGPAYLEGDLAENIGRVLPVAAAEHEALWFVFYLNGYASNAGQIRDWLNGNAYLSVDEWVSDGVMRRYATARGNLRTSKADANFADIIRLDDVALDESIRAPDDVRLELAWQAIADVSRDYTVFVHLVDDQGKRWGQFDAAPQQPTSRWRATESYLDRRAVQIASLPAGTYWLQVGLYSGEQRLGLATGSNFVKLGPIVAR